jgi:hypothetical protein
MPRDPVVRGLQPALHYELEQVSKIDILRKLKKRFGAKPSATSASALAKSKQLPSGRLAITAEHLR